MKEQARRESDLLVQETHAESRRITDESAAEKRRLHKDVSKKREDAASTEPWPSSRLWTTAFAT